MCCLYLSFGMELMQNEPPIIQVKFADKFKRNLRTLAKKYRSIRKDIQPIITQLEAGELPGDRIVGIDYTILKLRVKNSDIKKGKSGGYRVIYYVKTTTNIILITIYSKSEREDISAKEIKQVLAEFEQ
jgi:mRNA-degrading endonuclease RelE of RelBE toxin-antitoxin system